MNQRSVPRTLKKQNGNPTTQRTQKKHGLSGCTDVKFIQTFIQTVTERSPYLGVFEYLKVDFICTNEELKMQCNCCVTTQDRLQLLESVSADAISIILHDTTATQC